MDAADMGADLEKVLLTEDQIIAKLAELGAQIWKDYAGKDLLLVGVLKGAVMVMADLMRALPGTAPMDWMAISSYGSGTKSSGVVRIIKDLDVDITDRHVLIVEDIIDSGL
ncbi:MAG: phosphoribosyltransferase family protein, partial [Lapillicoccus sp.]